MLSRLSFILAMFVLVIASPSPGFAEDLESKAAKPLFSFKTDDRDPFFGERFTLKVGYKVWMAKWQAQQAATTTGAQTQANSDHPSYLNGPSITGILKLRDSEWFNAMVLNFTWLHDGFDFAEQSATGNHFYANRRDYTLTAGLAIWQGFGVFGGYYNSRQEFTNNPNQGGGFSPSRHPRSVEGPIFGVFGSLPASERVSFYGNLAYAQLKFKGACFLPNFCAETDSAQGWMNEVGFTVQGPRAWKIGTELQMGFRAQIIQKNFGANATGNTFPPGGSATNQQPLHDLTYGPIVAINAVF